jgi:putative SOS response-associated peptidase YedK
MRAPRQSPRNRAIADCLRASAVLFPPMAFTSGVEKETTRSPVWFHLKNTQPFAFAGLWDLWRDVDGEVLYTFTIITTIPNALMRRIHNRMPVIFDRLQAKQWLDPRLSTRSADIAADFAPFPSEQMQAHDVSPLVNKPEYDSADCIRPAPHSQGRLL